MKSTLSSRSSLPILIGTVVFLVTAFMLTGCGDNGTESKTEVPTVTTVEVTTITLSTAQTGGNVTSNGGASVTARGVCWCTVGAPTTANDTTCNGTGTGSFTSGMTGLTAGTTYYVRAYATNGVGTGYGSTVSFTTTGVVDGDGNVYETVLIGGQWWMAENLKVTHYRNGDAIPNVTDGAAWQGLSTGAYCEYGNDVGNVATYGRLYNWHAVVDSRNIAPEGWHVPTYAEIQTLYNYLGGTSVAGGKMKETGTTHWVSPNTGATNESGFTALPGGGRDDDGSYINIGSYGYFWSTTEFDSPRAWVLSLYTGYESVYPYGYSKLAGFSVRCVKD